MSIFDFSLPTMPTLDEVIAAKWWGLGGAAAMIAIVGLEWMDSFNNRPGEPRAEPEMVPHTLGGIATSVAIGAFLGVMLGVGQAHENDWAIFPVAAAAIVALAALFRVLHHPASRVPVGEKPPEEDDDSPTLAAKGTWAAVGLALAGLALALFDNWRG